jgi:SH3 domain protein
MAAAAWAEDGGRPQYISDDISVTLRDAPRNDAASIGSVSSGARVTVLQNLGDKSFAQIRTADGRTGWITGRFITTQPASKDRLRDLQTQLAESREGLKALQAELDQAKGRLEQARPAIEMAADNQRLRTELDAARQQYQVSTLQREEERSRRRTLITGGGLIIAGVVLGLILPLLGRSRRRRRSDF